MYIHTSVIYYYRKKRSVSECLTLSVSVNRQRFESDQNKKYSREISKLLLASIGFFV